MGWLDTPENRRKQHVQVIATGNIREMDRIHERDRRRNWLIFLDMVLILSILIGIGFIYYNKDYNTGLIFLAVGLIVILYFVFRKRRRPQEYYNRPRHFRHNRRR